MSKKPIGFVGLGVMGTPMVSHLHRHGYIVTLNDLQHEHTEALVAKPVGALAVIAAWLQQRGCNEAQGYLYAKPMPAEAFERWATFLSGLAGEARGAKDKDGILQRRMDEVVDGDVQVICLGPPEADDVLRAALAAGADSATRIDASPELDGRTVAGAIADHLHGADLVVCGEVGLGGEVRAVPQLELRLQEAYRLGFRRAVVPASAGPGPTGMTVIGVRTVAEALAQLRPPIRS